MKKHQATAPAAWLLILALMLFGLVPSAFAADTVTAEGVAYFTGNDTAAARAKALDQALRTAVEQQVGVLITSQSVVDNYTLVSDKILNQSQGYIESYQITSQGVRGQGEYVVTISAVVKKGKLTSTLENLGLLQALKEKPKLVVLIDEKNMSAGRGFGDVAEAETTLVQEFMVKGFRVVDPESLRRSIDRESALRAIAGDDKAAATIAQRYGAQIAVMGKAHASSGPRIQSTNMRSIQAVVTARVVETDSAKIIAAGSESAAKPHIHPVTGGSLALASASKKLAKKLISDITAQWQKDVYGSSRELVLSVTGLTSYLALDEVMSFLENQVQGVKAVHQRSFTQGAAELGLDYAGSTRDLARDLARHQFQGFALNPTDVTPNKISARAEKK
ncbi:MAG: hypothetical protein SVS15_09665 [Thermodesulfobacteriota bacterium]|nr:hypothetical protein [Thermodesulfobacteriota bacterium]